MTAAFETRHIRCKGLGALILHYEIKRTEQDETGKKKKRKSERTSKETKYFSLAIHINLLTWTGSKQLKSEERMEELTVCQGCENSSWVVLSEFGLQLKVAKLVHKFVHELLEEEDGPSWAGSC
jgi:hypothetical protein